MWRPVSLALVLLATVGAMTLTGRQPVSRWAEGSTIGIPADNGKRPIALFVRWDGQFTIPGVSLPPGQWHTVSLANGPQWDRFGDSVTWQPDLPADTKAVFLSGMLVITHPSDRVIICDLWANFRAPGSALGHDSYQMQAIEATIGAGQRSTAAVWVPVVNRQFEFYWSTTPGCPALINLSLQSYVR